MVTIFKNLILITFVALISFSQALDLDYFEEAVDYMLNLEYVDKEHGVALSGLSKAGEIVLSMAAFLPCEKLSGVIAMNSVMNCFGQGVMYKGKQVISGDSPSSYITSTQFKNH